MIETQKTRVRYCIDTGSGIYLDLEAKKSKRWFD